MHTKEFKKDQQTSLMKKMKRKRKRLLRKALKSIEYLFKISEDRSISINFDNSDTKFSNGNSLFAGTDKWIKINTK